MHDAPLSATTTSRGLPTVVDRLTTERGYPLLTGADSQPWLNDDGIWIVFMPGHGKGSGETADVAVILPELLRVIPTRLKPAVAGPDAEKALLERTGMMSLPALAFLRGPDLLGVISRVRGWDDYLERIALILSGASSAPPSATIQ